MLRLVVFLVALMQLADALTLCPQLAEITTATSSPQVLAAAGATILLQGTLDVAAFPPPPPLTAWPINGTGGISVSAEIADTGDGLSTALASPDGFVRRYAVYISQISTEYAFALDASNKTAVRISITLFLQQFPFLNVQVPEILRVSLRPDFFGARVGNGSSFPLCDAAGPLIGSIIVPRTPPSALLEATSRFAEITTWVAMAATGVLGLGGSPSSAVDAQSLFILGSTACSSSTERYALRSLRGLTPLAADATVSGMLWGTAVGIAGAWVVWGLALCLVRACQRKPGSWSDAAALIRFPALPFAVTLALYQGATFAAVRGFVRGVGVDNYGSAAGGLIGAGLLMAVVPIVVVFFAHLGISAELVDRRPLPTEVWLSRLVHPEMFWRPAKAVRMAGYIFSDLSRRERWLSALPFAPAIAMSIVGGVEPRTVAGCTAQLATLGAVQGLFAILTAVVPPARLGAMCSLRIGTHVAIAAAASVVAVSIDKETATPSGVVIPVCIAFGLVCLRLAIGFACDVVEWRRNKEEGPVVGVLWWGHPWKGKAQPPPVVLPPPPPPPPPPPVQAPPVPEVEKPVDPSPPVDDLDRLLDDLDREAAEGTGDGDDFFDDLLAGAGVDSRNKSSKLRDFTSSKILRATRVLDSIKEAKFDREQFEMFGDVHAAKPDFLRGGRGPSRSVGPGAATKLAEMLSNMKPREEAATMPKQQPVSTTTSSSSPSGPPPALPYKLLPDGETGDASTDYIVVFRVESGQLRRQPEKEFGCFHEGDAYVIECHKAAPINSYELFAWIGKLSTPDEIQAAVEHAVERDEMLESDFHPLTFSGGYPITRLFQGRETSAFLALFPGRAIHIAKGGIDKTGAPQPMLFHVHGTTMKETAVTPVPPTLESLDEGDVFILDLGTVLYVFQGTGCSPMERMAAARYAMDISVSRTICRVVVVSTADSPDEFWERLGTTREQALSKPIVRTDALHPNEVPRLFEIKSRNTFDLVADGAEKVRRYTPSTKRAYVYDMCHAVFVWVGKETEPFVLTRAHALEEGAMYLKQHSEPYVPLTRLLEGFEGQRFAELVGK